MTLRDKHDLANKLELYLGVVLAGGLVFAGNYFGMAGLAELGWGVAAISIGFDRMTEPDR